jgi:hypothetical protein
MDSPTKMLTREEMEEKYPTSPNDPRTPIGNNLPKFTNRKQRRAFAAQVLKYTRGLK